ncbi:MAG: hypothetical protein MH204_03180, partial [Fimbriimonadaceae bacterium]|nr:hypothetical protein [Fimbriimonadaceae bacterium]
MGADELLQEIGVRSVDLHRVESGLGGPVGGIAEGLDRLFDLLDRHGLWRFRVGSVGGDRGRAERSPSAEPARTGPASVVDLQ